LSIESSKERTKMNFEKHSKTFGCKCVLYGVKFFIHKDLPYVGILYEVEKSSVNPPEIQFWPRAIMMSTKSSDKQATDFNILVKTICGGMFPPGDYSLEDMTKIGLELEQDMAKRGVIAAVGRFPYIQKFRRCMLFPGSHPIWTPTHLSFPSNFIERYPEVNSTCAIPDPESEDDSFIEEEVIDVD
jgi:hypothetical protein